MAHMNYFITASLMEVNLKVALVNLEMNLGILIVVCLVGVCKAFGKQVMTDQISITPTDPTILLQTNLRSSQQPMTGVLLMFSDTHVL
jgi:tRNA A37 threonylcarbamoyladenosine dehydratase